MNQAELLIGGLLVAVAGLGALARWLSIPYPIILVVGGAIFGFIPGVPTVKLDPDDRVGRRGDRLGPRRRAE